MSNETLHTHNQKVEKLEGLIKGVDVAVNSIKQMTTDARIHHYLDSLKQLSAEAKTCIPEKLPEPQDVIDAWDAGC